MFKAVSFCLPLCMLWQLQESFSLSVKKMKSREISQRSHTTREGKFLVFGLLLGYLLISELTAVLMDNSPWACTYISIIDFMITPLPVESITVDEENLSVEKSWRKCQKWNEEDHHKQSPLMLSQVIMDSGDPRLLWSLNIHGYPTILILRCIRHNRSQERNSALYIYIPEVYLSWLESESPRTDAALIKSHSLSCKD